MSTPLLEVEDLHCVFRTANGDVRAVDGVSFTIEQGESLGVVGESGSGKTVTAMSILRLFGPTTRARLSGTARLNGVDLLRASNRELRRVRGGEVGMIFQDPLTSLDPVMPVSTQIGETLRLHRGMTRDAARKRAIELMERVGIPDAGSRADDLPHRFSGGMRQRIMIAIAIACEPKLLIADEATTALDATVQAQVLGLLGELKDELGMATMVISHDIGVIAAVCDTVQVMYAGRIVERAPLPALLGNASHPYASALLHLVPRLDHSKHHRLRPIPGQPPILVGPRPPGCSFAARCTQATDACTQEPPVKTVGEGHTAACWFAGADTEQGVRV